MDELGTNLCSWHSPLTAASQLRGSAVHTGLLGHPRTSPFRSVLGGEHSVWECQAAQDAL